MAPVATGLTEAEAVERLAFFGPNALEEKKTNIFLKFIGYFWGPMPIMIWIASIIELINESWPDLGVLLLLQLINGLVGFVEEKVREWSRGLCNVDVNIPKSREKAKAP